MKSAAAIAVAGIFLSSFAVLFMLHVSRHAVRSRGRKPYRGASGEWSIGMYLGDSLIDLCPGKRAPSPVLTAADVSDVPAEFVADPFMVREGDTWYMFFEVMNSSTGQGEIGLAESGNGFAWTYRQIVLAEPFHLSYPYTFKWQDDCYMIPEAGATQTVRLYKADPFPARWRFIGDLVKGRNFADASVVHYNNVWWLFASNPECDTLWLFSSDRLTGPYAEHPKSPLIQGDKTRARPGGRIVESGGSLIRFAQDDYPRYGRQVRAFEITVLTADAYEERELPGSPVVRWTGLGWNARAMHHIDPHRIDGDRWIAAVDGFGTVRRRPALLDRRFWKR